MKAVNDAKVKGSELLLAVFVPEVNARILQKTLQANKVSFTKYKHFLSLGFLCQAMTLKKQKPKTQILRQEQSNEEILCYMLFLQ